MHKKLVRQAGTTVSEEELWDQSIQVTLLIHSGAIVLHEGTKEHCATSVTKGVSRVEQ